MADIFDFGKQINDVKFHYIDVCRQQKFKLQFFNQNFLYNNIHTKKKFTTKMMRKPEFSIHTSNNVVSSYCRNRDLSNNNYGLDSPETLTAFKYKRAKGTQLLILANVCQYIVELQRVMPIQLVLPVRNTNTNRPKKNTKKISLIFCLFLYSNGMQVHLNWFIHEKSWPKVY